MSADAAPGSGHRQTPPRSDKMENVRLTLTEDDKETVCKTKFTLKRRELLVCIIGLGTFAVGLILIVVSLVLLSDRCNGQSHGRLPSAPVSGYPMTALYRSDLSRPPDAEAHHHGNETTRNLALDKSAYQSSTHDANGTRYSALLAVDDDASPRVSSGSCAQTEWEEQPWWYVDLHDIETVSSVKMTIPRDCCVADLHNFVVRVSLSALDRESRTECRFHMGVALTSSLQIDCDNPLRGRYVMIEMLGDASRPNSRLTLCDVAVY
ncbi:hypothetical protein CAPTEDRAFT_222850 [Capitella teleta]|uniref:Fucolectin tachylectin-4 pentraxin-1 domain-containing protein n=1 Tax=Capitella teleta TaxID=283909 RepID=R7V1I2_CAPTE|nr:hypothetical protein CAPTEDRAFT_222850 [Capitella teleta]|eukprot:ELU12424.1 hypothetical protein CAPTEDRAFT_222850 [Capitella teleta]